MLTVAVIGPTAKNLYGYEHEPYKKLTNILLRKFAALAEFDPDLVVVTGGAQGTDQVAFWAAVHAKKKYPSIRTQVLIPYKGQDEDWNETGAFSKVEYRKMLRCADDVECCTAEDGLSKADASQERRRFEVSGSDIVISVSKDGAESPFTEYAFDKKKCVNRINL